jgi:hypothetical protein
LAAFAGFMVAAFSVFSILAMAVILGDTRFYNAGRLAYPATTVAGTGCCTQVGLAGRYLGH